MLVYSAILLAGFYTTNAVKVLPADLAFGRAQVEQFIHDRPDAGAVINRHPAFKEQLAVLFADDGQGFDGEVEHVHWDNRKPTSPFSQCHYASNGYRSLVRVTSTTALSATDKCACLAFELHNIRSGNRFHALVLMAYRKQISREDYVRNVVRTEFDALKKTKEFLLKYPLGDPDANNNPEYAWNLKISGGFANYFRHMKSSEGSADYLNNYRHEYDQIISSHSYSEEIAILAEYRASLIANDRSSIFNFQFKADSSETADDNASSSTATRLISPHIWGDRLDWTLTLSFFTFITLVLITGYGSMGLHIRDYLRSLRRALVVLGHYSRELPHWILRDRPRCIQALDLTLPCTASEVLAAYRKKVKLVHPDRGGDHREFLRLQEHFEQAMALAGDCLSANRA